MDDGRPIGTPQDMGMSMNQNIYSIVKEIFSESGIKTIPHPAFSESAEFTSYAEFVNNARVASYELNCGMPHSFKEETTTSLCETFTRLMAWVEIIQQAQSKAVSNFNKYRKGTVDEAILMENCMSTTQRASHIFKKNLRSKSKTQVERGSVAGNYIGKENAAEFNFTNEFTSDHYEGKEVKLLPAGQCDFHITLVNSTYVVHVFGKTFIMTKDSIASLKDVLTSLAHLAVSFAVIHCKGSGIDAYLDIVDTILDVGVENPEATGEIIKQTRNVLVASQDKDNYLGRSAKSMFKAMIKAEMRESVDAIYTKFQEHIYSRRSVFLLTMLYKLVPHPNTRMEDMFDTSKGSTKANKAEPDEVVKFRNYCVKEVTTNLLKNGKGVRLICLDPHDSTAKKIVDSVNSTTATHNTVKDIPSELWKNVGVDKNNKLGSITSMELKPENKASASTVEVTDEDLKKIRDWSWKAGKFESPPPELLTALKNVNDIKSSALGEALLDIGPAWKRFCKVVRKFEEYERSLGLSVEDRDNLTSENIKKFVEKNPDCAYLINTEPKFGEYHKEITRIFYIMEQPLKAITQRIERLCRQISRKQEGVSITKGHAERKRDIQEFAAMMVDTLEDTKSVFISFDISKFSQKFPHELLRVYGEILAALTGDDELRRLDLIFKSCIVYQNSRGYFDYFSGVTGGFEGIFNFVWTSIHAIIMGMARENANIEGRLLSYSDDGLLQFLVSTKGFITDEDVKVKVQNIVSIIQETYKKLGLTFHLGKTIVSSTVWEYLGVICTEGNLLPSWMKEICSIGKIENTLGFNPKYKTISIMESQVQSAIAAECPQNICGFIKNYYFRRYMNHISPGISDTLSHLLSIIPPSCGGFRITSDAEDGVDDTVSKIDEIDADIRLFRHRDPEIAMCIKGFLLSHMKGPSVAVDGIMTGSLLKTDLPDTSGRAIMMRLYDEVRESSTKTFPKDPVTHRVRENLDIEFRKIVNLDPDIISSYISALPAVNDYNIALAFVSNSSVLSILDRKTIMRAQINDSKKCREAIEEWNKFIINGDKACTTDLITLINKNIYSAYNMNSKKRSIRKTIGKLKSNFHATVITDLRPSTRNTTLNQFPYRERLDANILRDDSVSWSSQFSPESNMAKMKSALKIYTSSTYASPDLGGFYHRIANIFNIILPRIPVQRIIGLDRKRELLGNRQNINLNMPKLLESRMTIVYSRDFDRLIRGNKGFELSTLNAHIKAATGRQLVSKGIYTNRNQLKMHTNYYSMSNTGIMFREIMTVKAGATFAEQMVDNLDQIPVSITNDLKAAIDDKETDVAIRASLEDMVDNDYDYGDRDDDYLSAILSNRVAGVFESLFSSKGRAADKGAVIATIGQLTSNECVNKGILLAFSRSLDAYTKRELVRDNRDIVVDREFRINPQFVAKHSAAYSLLDRYLSSIKGIPVNKSGLKTWFRDINMVAKFVYNYHKNTIIHDILFAKQKIVITPESGAGGHRASKQSAGVLRDIMRNTISSFDRTVGTEEGQVAVTNQLNELGIGLDLHVYILMIKIYKNTIRSSEHRVGFDQANKFTFTLRAFQIFAIIYDYANYLTDNDVGAFHGRITRENEANWRNNMTMIGRHKLWLGRKASRPGYDHTKMANDPYPEWVRDAALGFVDRIDIRTTGEFPYRALGIDEFNTSNIMRQHLWASSMNLQTTGKDTIISKIQAHIIEVPHNTNSYIEHLDPSFYRSNTKSKGNVNTNFVYTKYCMDNLEESTYKAIAYAMANNTQLGRSMGIDVNSDIHDGVKNIIKSEFGNITGGEFFSEKVIIDRLDANSISYRAFDIEDEVNALQCYCRACDYSGRDRSIHMIKCELVEGGGTIILIILINIPRGWDNEVDGNWEWDGSDVLWNRCKIWVHPNQFTNEYRPRVMHALSSESLSTELALANVNTFVVASGGISIDNQDNPGNIAYVVPNIIYLAKALLDVGSGNLPPVISYVIFNYYLRNRLRYRGEEVPMPRQQDVRNEVVRIIDILSNGYINGRYVTPDAVFYYDDIRALCIWLRSYKFTTDGDFKNSDEFYNFISVNTNNFWKRGPSLYTPVFKGLPISPMEFMAKVGELRDDIVGSIGELITVQVEPPRFNILYVPSDEDSDFYMASGSDDDQ
jgi:hypothetical protein